jgi:cell division protein FtsB
MCVKKLLGTLSGARLQLFNTWSSRDKSRLEEDNKTLQDSNVQLKGENDALCTENEQLRAIIQNLKSNGTGCTPNGNCSSTACSIS